MGREFELTFNGSTQYKTFTGGIISLILSSLLIIGSIYFGKEIFVKENPIVIPTYQIFEDFQKLNTTNELFFMVGIQTPFYEYYVDETVYSIEGNYYGYENNTENFFYEPFQPVLCSKMFKDSDVSHLLPGYTYDLSKFWCVPDLDKNYIEGFFGSKLDREVQFVVSKCKNTTEYHGCKSEEELDQILQGGIIAIQSNRYVMDSKNLKSPLKLETVDTFQGLNLGLQIDFYFSLKVLEFQTDVGFLLPSYEYLKKFDYNEPKLIYTLKNKDFDDGILSKISFFGSNKGFRYLRSYEKIQEVVTKIGGFLKAITLVGQLISYLSSHIEFNNDIINNLEVNKKKLDLDLKLFQNNSNNNLREQNLEIQEVKRPISNLNSGHIINENNENNLERNNLQINNFMKIKTYNFSNDQEKEILNVEDSNKKASFLSVLRNHFSSLHAYLFVSCCSNHNEKINIIEKNLNEIISLNSIIKNHYFVNFLQENICLIDEENKLSSKYKSLDLFSEYSSLLINSK